MESIEKPADLFFFLFVLRESKLTPHIVLLQITWCEKKCKILEDLVLLCQIVTNVKGFKKEGCVGSGILKTAETLQVFVQHNVILYGCNH
jgi:hypothetical protein